ncbi:alpha/beta hydrolase family protein [Stakelama pacifica]|uniref:Prolyl oligopeptidase family protein n=1 Tax=Stakelama pacifica TaxID=517720 RepID=A0A4R6FUD0_9SPHN|nr:S9 family peptidase [Stakelama pacifica]TDN85413.1 prolyl oligopeptidase family protein [Stakelama pacifica]GGO92720.1 peptidase S9 [Stakelama pacifica]
MRHSLRSVTLTALLASSAIAYGATPPPRTDSHSLSETAKAFGQLPDIQAISLSPDGNRAAIVTPNPIDGGTVLAISSLEGTVSTKPILKVPGGSARIRYCGWISMHSLICKLQVTADTYALGQATVTTRLLAVKDDGSDQKVLSSQATPFSLGFSNIGGSIVYRGSPDHPDALVTHDYIPESTTGTHLANTSEGVGLDAIDPDRFSAKMVERPTAISDDYIADMQGNVRIRVLDPVSANSRLNSQLVFQFREAGGNQWRDFSSYDRQTEQGFYPVLVDSKQNIAYGFANLNGRRALFTKQLSEGSAPKLLFSRPDVDVDGLQTIGRRARMVGASYTTDFEHIEMFDPQLKSLLASFHKALPDLPVLSVDDASDDESILLIRASSDTDPGHYYVFDKKTGHLDEVFRIRPQLKNYALAPVKQVTIPADDGALIPAYLTMPVGSDGKNLPAIVLPHGGPSARDSWGFDWLSQFFAARGFVVLQPNYRGSSGYGDSWFQNNGFRSWDRAISDVNDTGRWLVKQGIADPAKLAIVGWSYGGYAALQSQVLDPDLFKAVVAIAPVTDFELTKDESRNYTNYGLVAVSVGSGEHIASGSPARHADSFKAPVLMFHGTSDANVDIMQSRVMLDRLRRAGKQADLVTFDGFDHQLADAKVRAEMLEKADQFLHKSLNIK